MTWDDDGTAVVSVDVGAMRFLLNADSAALLAEHVRSLRPAELLAWADSRCRRHGCPLLPNWTCPACYW
jgi:hypothetical protein